MGDFSDKLPFRIRDKRFLLSWETSSIHISNLDFCRILIIMHVAMLTGEWIPSCRAHHHIVWKWSKRSYFGERSELLWKLLCTVCTSDIVTSVVLFFCTVGVTMSLVRPVMSYDLRLSCYCLMFTFSSVFKEMTAFTKPLKLRSLCSQFCKMRIFEWFSNTIQCITRVFTILFWEWRTVLTFVNVGFWALGS